RGSPTSPRARSARRNSRGTPATAAVCCAKESSPCHGAGDKPISTEAHLMELAPPDPNPVPSDRPPRPSPQEVLEGLARDGAVGGLAEAILHTHVDQVPPTEAYALLHKALHGASRGDAADFCDRLFRAMVPFAAYAVLRLQHLTLPTVTRGE